MESNDDEYPHISEYAIITIEGYCMLNIEYSMKKDPFNYQYLPDGSFQEVENTAYDPFCKPDQYPDECLRYVNHSCISCKHFAWCESEEK